MRTLLTALVVCASLGDASVAAAGSSVSVSVVDLVERAVDYAGQTVTVEGELVGDYGVRSGQWMWTQLNGDSYVASPLREGGSVSTANIGVGVRMPVDAARNLDPPGGYRHRGPVVRITGVWRYHDPSRAGETYLDVTSLTVMEPGRRLSEDTAPLSIVVGVLLLVAAGGMGLLWRRP